MPRPRPVIDSTHLWISGNVVIDPTATIAPDVLLQADPNCQLVVAAGACIGTGSVLHAHEGKLTIEAGAILGSGVLVVGHGTIGAEACIGAMSTIIDSCSIEANQSVPPNSLIGDSSRQVDLTQTSTFVPPVSPFVPPSPPTPPVSPFVPPQPTPIAPQIPLNPPIAPVASPFVPPTPVSNFSPPHIPANSNFSNSNSSGSNGVASPPGSNLTAPPPKKAITQIYGQAYLERIMITMFPHRQHVLEPLPPPDDPAPPPAQ